MPVPVAPPILLPTLTPAQSAFLADWLTKGGEHGIAGVARTPMSPIGDGLARAAIERARALRTGSLASGGFLEVWAMRPEPYDAVADFAQAVAADRLPQWAASLTPPYAGYDGLRKGLAAYEAIRAKGGWPTVSAQTPPAQLIARIAIEDAGVTAATPLAEAIQKAQRRYGLNPTGTLDARTLAELNVPVAQRIDAMRANMERWRWLPRNLPVNRVQVNIAAAVLTLFEGDKPIFSMRAVTGSPKNQTPMLSSSIHSVLLNPPWNVPASIAKKELWPKGKAALIAQGYQIVGTPETGQRIVQPAGPGSALGRIKFDFDNPFAVYLHDTPARARFSSYDRLASHGCVRLEKPVPLAEYLMRGSPTAGQVQALIDTGKTQRVALPQRVAVYLLYWTAFASGNGTMNFRSDPYGWDALLAKRLDSVAVASAAPVKKDVP